LQWPQSLQFPAPARDELSDFKITETRIWQGTLMRAPPHALLFV
jgi:hypothetical protein